MYRKLLHFASAGLCAVALAQSSLLADDDRDEKSNNHELNAAGAGGAPTKGSTGVITPAITYHNGPLINTPTLYYIWYGNWAQTNGSDTAAGQQILTDFAHSIGGSPYFQLNTSYSTSTYTVSGNATYGGSATDAYSQGTRLSDRGVLTVVGNAIKSGHIPYNANGVYFVLTSSDVNETSGFCTQYCGWHTAGSTTSGHVRYGFIGNANRCLGSCAAQTVGPNGNAGVDGMISVVAHELEEATSDPDITGWYDRNGAENADKCAWTFGQNPTLLASGAYYNVTLGARNYLIQRNLKHSTSGDTCNLDATHQ
jgi:Phosphate-induced protein 1 conserved region